MWKRILLCAAAAGLTLCLLILALVLSHAKGDQPQKSDVILILGCMVWGTDPSPALTFRLEKALELYQQGFSDRFLVSGGQGPDEGAPEAEVMEKWLVSRGVPEGHILQENQATSTFENLKYSLDIMKQNDLQSALLVTSDFHVYRTMLLARRLGIEATGIAAPSVASLRLYSYLREMASVVKSWVLDR